MKKAVLFIFILLSCRLQAQSLKTNLPAEFIALQPYDIQLLLNKGNCTGTASLKIISGNANPVIYPSRIPNGILTAEGNIQIITWQEIPTDSIIASEVRITFPESAAGNYDLKLILEYNDNGTSAEKILFSQPVKIHPPSKATAGRIITQISENQYVISLEINKPLLGGFAKIYEKLPASLKAVSTECRNCVWKSEPGMLKISWDDFLPEDSLVTVKYKLHSTSGFPELTGTLSAEFLLGNNDNTAIVTTEKNILKTEEVIAAVKNENPPEKKENPIVVTASVNPEIRPDPVISSSDTVFRVQFAAGHPGVSKEYFAKKYHITEPIYVEYIDGYAKFSVGQFADLDEALKKRNQMNQSAFKNPFVIALVDGKRIKYHPPTLK